MRILKIGYAGALLGVLMICFSTVAMAAYDPTAKILSKIQGTWYDSSGNAVLDFQGDTVNGCKIVGVYRPAGGGADFSCIIRIVENGEYRDLPIIGENLGNDNYHSHIIFNGDNRDASKGILLMRTTDVKFQESVGGVGIDMTEKELLSKYGKPSSIIESRSGVFVWKYQNLGLV